VSSIAPTNTVHATAGYRPPLFTRSIGCRLLRGSRPSDRSEPVHQRPQGGGLDRLFQHDKITAQNIGLDLGGMIGGDHDRRDYRGEVLLDGLHGVGTEFVVIEVVVGQDDIGRPLEA